MQKTKYSKDHPVVAFVALLMFFVFLDFYMTSLPSVKQLERTVATVKVLNRVFPEGAPYYNRAVESILYVVQKSGQLNVKEPLAYALKDGVSPLVKSWASKYLLVFGAIYGFFYKLGVFALLMPVVFVAVFLLKNIQLLKPFVLYLKAFWLAPIKTSRVIKLVLLHLSNPVPASISHHEPREGGLLRHSLRVAQIALREGEGLNREHLALASLLHDVGKIRLYKKEKYQSVSAPSPVVVERKKKEGERWISLQVNQKVVNFVLIRELQKRFNLPEFSKEVWDVVRYADKKATEEELRTGLYKVSHLIKETLGDLEYYKDKKDGWRKGNYLFVLAHAVGRRLSLKLMREDPLIEIDPEPTGRGVHTVLYSLIKDKGVPLVWEVEGKRADDLGLFDLRVRGVLFKAVLCFDLSKINLDVPQLYKDNELEVLERVGAELQKEEVEADQEPQGRVV